MQLKSSEAEEGEGKLSVKRGAKIVMKNWGKTLNSGITSQALAIHGFIRSTALHNGLPEKIHYLHFSY